MKTNHWGIHLDSQFPTTGVFSLNSLEYIQDDIDNGIDLDYQEVYRESKKTAKAEGERFPEYCMDEYEQSEALIGFKKYKRKGQWQPDTNAEYTAYASLGQMGSNVLQVISSKWGIRCAHCSPCYPGQGDAETLGMQLCYSVPPSLVGDNDYEGLEQRIFPLKPDYDNPRLPQFMEGYLYCALWASRNDDTDKPLSEDHNPRQLSVAAYKAAQKDCERFLREWGYLIKCENIEESCYLCEYRAGGDFWLTRNRHGAGFWDGKWEESVGKQLTDASHEYSELDLFVYRNKVRGFGEGRG